MPHLTNSRFTMTLILELLHVITISYIIIIKYSPSRIFSTTMYLMRMETKYTESRQKQNATFLEFEIHNGTLKNNKREVILDYGINNNHGESFLQLCSYFERRQNTQNHDRKQISIFSEFHNHKRIFKENRGILLRNDRTSTVHSESYLHLRT